MKARDPISKTRLLYHCVGGDTKAMSTAEPAETLTKMARDWFNKETSMFSACLEAARRLEESL